MVTPGLSHAYDLDEVQEAVKNGRTLNVDLEVCTLCDWNCRYCYLPRRDYLPELKDLERMIDAIADIEPKTVLFTGGEPFLHPDIMTLLDYAVRERKLSVSIFTNGSKITPSIAEKLHSLGVKICLKMDSLDSSIQDYLTQINGSCRLIQNAVRNLKEVGYTADLPLAIHAAVTSRNILTIPELWKWAKGQNITPHCTRLVVHGNAQEQVSLNPSIADLRKLFGSLADIDGRENLIPFPKEVGCLKMYISCFVCSNGDVQPCSNVPISGGNIYQENLREIIRESEIFKIVRNVRQHTKGACATCRHKDACYGCRGLAHSITGDFLAEDPCCWHTS